MGMARNSVILWIILLLITICSLSLAASAQYASTYTYVFDTEQSNVIKTGGIAGVHETYPIQGQFQLKVDINAATASFGKVDAFLLSPISSSPPQSLSELFNMTELEGTVVNDLLIEFRGKTADDTNTNVALKLTFDADSVQLKGQTIPPSSSADFFIFNLDAFAQKKYSGGSGTAVDPYLIITAEQMNTIGANPNDWNKHFRLMADIDLSGFTGGARRPHFNIIGYFISDDDNKPFTGVFNGNGHTISNFSFTSMPDRTENIGLFGYVDDPNAEIRDLELIDSNVDAGTSRQVGSLVGNLQGGTITNCYIEGGSISGNNHTGGLVGNLNWGTITNCTSSASVSGNDYVGGLAGQNRNGTITASSNTGAVTGGGWFVGGLAGGNSGRIAKCYSSGDISGYCSVGGLVGTDSVYGTIYDCYAAGRVSGDWEVGGLVGSSGCSYAHNSFWDTQTSGQTTSAGGKGRTTSQMQMASTFLGWDKCGNEAVWTIDEGNDYPRLWWENKPGKVLETQKLSALLTGAGTEDDPYLIYTAEELNVIGVFPCESDKHFKLMADIDLSHYDRAEFNIIGILNPFTGVLDGNGKKIINLNNSRGLFVSVRGTIKDLGLIDANVDAGVGNSIGLLAGEIKDGTITNCYSEGGRVSGNGGIGGLVGIFNKGRITNCYATGSVTGTNWHIGGLVGYGYFDSIIINCYSSGDVSGVDSVGGLVGTNHYRIMNCYSRCDVLASGTDWWPGVGGGLVGENSWDGTIYDCYSAGGVMASEWPPGVSGGLVGENRGEVIDSFWDTQTSGQTTSAGGTGKTTAEMQMASTFLDGGWDFVDESVNGTDDIWWILEDQDYPRLWWESLNDY